MCPSSNSYEFHGIMRTERSTNRNMSGSLKEEKMLWEHKKSKREMQIIARLFSSLS